MLLPINADHPEPRKIRRAVEALNAGEVIAYPTDTAYALCCDVLNKKAIDRLYLAKGMPRTQPLAFVCPDLGDVAKYAIVEKHHYRILRHYLPGPYCFVLEATRAVPKLLLTKQKTVGIRVPKHPVPQMLAQELGRPLVSTTAHKMDQPLPYVDPREILDDFPGVELAIDGGPGGTVGTTVVDLTKNPVEVVREGAGDLDEFL